MGSGRTLAPGRDSEVVTKRQPVKVPEFEDHGRIQACDKRKSGVGERN